MINEIILNLIASKRDFSNFKNYFEQLGFKLNQFIHQFKLEIKCAGTLKFELLKLLSKLKVIQHYTGDHWVESIATSLTKSIYQNIPQMTLVDLLIFETYHSLGLTSQLSGQDKLLVKKVKNLDLYSELLACYKKPQITQKNIEQYFEKNRTELLMNLVASEKKIVHIHYDMDYLESYVCNKMMLDLLGENIDEQLNLRIEKELLS
ncbi:hypothetical protein [Acinetobacter sp. NCu2D-2]|uniref:hypothetical protein n=1 Tax=Acinetobacter sp. NCu2D-2 TaxID=1608473 RepID=UPI0012FE82FC|nr:hypothetical protein [Acinetobacter sp. NCu2D-2]